MNMSITQCMVSTSESLLYDPHFPMQHKIASLQAIAQKPANYVKYYEYYLK